MPRWNVKSEDETENLGNGKLYAAQDHVEEWLTLCTFENTSEIYEKPVIKTATCSAGMICITMDETICVFEDEKSLQILFTVDVESIIDCCTFIEKSNVILIGTRTGEVCCFNLEGCIIFKRKVPVQESSDFTLVNFVVEAIEKQVGGEKCSVLIVSHCGGIFRISWHSSSKLVKKPDVTFQTLEEKLNWKVTDVIRPVVAEYIALVGENLALWRGCEVDSCSFSDFGLKPCIKAQVLRDKFFLCLASEGELSVICAKTLLLCAIWQTYIVQDFIIFEDKHDHHKDCIVMITADTDSPMRKYVVLATLPDFKICHKLQISQSSWLCTTLPNIMYIEDVISRTNIPNLKLNILLNFDPQHRLSLLLTDKKFDEAETFAIQYGLDVEIVMKERVVFDITTLSLQHDSSCFKKLIFTLDRISDINFVATFCVQKYIHHIDDMKNLWRYGLDRIHAQEIHRHADLQKMQLELYSRLWNLETLSFVVTNISHNAEKWKNILDLDWLKTCVTFLTKNDLKKAETVWLRHLQTSIIHDTKNVMQLFIYISPLMKPNEVLSWIQLVMPCILQHTPDVMENLTEWIIQRAKLLEKTGAEWPGTAIIFIEEVYTLIAQIAKSEEGKSSYLFGKQNVCLQTFLFHLREVQLLKRDYGLNIPLEEFLQDNKLEVAKNILSKVIYYQNYDVNKIVNGFMKTFMMKYNLSMDSVVLYFIKKIFATVDEHWVSVNCWEPVVETCITYVESVKDKIECILNALKFASIPWSKTMMELANEGRKLNHPLASEIKKLEEISEIKLVLKKYELEVEFMELSKFSVSFFILKRIFKEASVDFLKDALIIAGDSLKLQTEAYVLCIHHFISNEMYGEAQNLLESLESKVFEICCERLLCRMQFETDLTILYYYIDIICSVSSRLTRNCVITGDFELIRNLYIINLNYKFKVTLLDFSKKHIRYNLFKLWVKSLVAACIENKTDVDSVYNNAKDIAQLCFLPPGDGLLEISEYFTGKELVDIDNSKILLFSRDKLQHSSKKHLMKISGGKIMDEFYCRLMTNNILVCSLSLNDPWLHILSWINRARDTSRISVYRKSEIVNDFGLLHVFQDGPGCAWKPEVIKIVQTLFLLLEQSEKVSCEDIIMELEHLSAEFSVGSVSVMMIALLNMIRCCLQYYNFQSVSVVDSHINKILKILLSKMIHLKNCDIHFAGAILTSMDAMTAECWLNNSVKEFRNRFQKLERIAKLGMFYSKLNYLKLDFKYLNAECMWAKQFRRCGIEYEKYLAEEKAYIVTTLVLKNEIMMAENFCKTFNMDLPSLLPKCLEEIILSWQPEFELTVSKEGKKEIYLKNNEDAVVEKCKSIVERMNRINVEKCLEKILLKVNYYFYEMYFCVNRLKKMVFTEQENTSSFLLLLFLRNYQRISSLQEKERNIWFEKYQSFVEFPAIAEWRLPFWPSDMWRVIESELTLNNYKQWLQVADVLKVNKDHIGAIVLKFGTRAFEHDNCVSANIDWSMDILDERTLSLIRECANEMSNKELACAALFQAFRSSKHRVLKEQLVMLCFELAKKWADLAQTDDAITALKNVNRAYLDLSTENILYKYRLEMPCYLLKVSKPEILLRELYYHPSIVKKSLNADDNCPDINSAVNEIAKVHVNIKINKFLLSLIEEWLSPLNSVNDSFDDTITIQGNLLTQQRNPKEKENFLRASYLLNKKDSSTLLATLLNVIFENEAEENIKFKLNVLICVLNTLSMENVSNICGKTPESIRLHLQNLRFTSELDSLGMLMTVSQFETCEKQDLVRELINSSQRNSSILVLATHLALNYRIFDVDVWEQLLKYMIQWNWLEELENALKKLPVNIPGIIDAWNHVLFAPFHSCTVPLSDEQSESCIHSLKLLYLCPIAFHLDLFQLGQLCCQLNSPHWAALILNFMSVEQRQILKKKILCNSSINEISMKLEEIEDSFMPFNIRTILEDTSD